MEQVSKPAQAILRRPQVEARTGLGCSAIYAEIAKGRFPKPVKLSARSVGWVSTSIDLWIASRPEANLKRPAGAAA